MNDFQHKPVLLNEVVGYLETDKPKTVVIDATVGLGGHSRVLMSSLGEQAHLLAIDRDQQALAQAKQNLRAWERRAFYYHMTYDRVRECWLSSGLPRASFVLLDLGVSSLQLDAADRGFSFQKDAELDMRMDQKQLKSARHIVNEYSEIDLLRIFRDYGEEPQAKRVAQAIVQHRKNEAITRTTQLAHLVKKALPYAFSKRHPATKVFQALRIEVNEELKKLEIFLQSDFDFIESGGRLVLISFHSLEDRIVKKMGQQTSEFKVLTKKPVLPSAEEAKENPRARSAKLRVLEKR